MTGFSDLLALRDSLRLEFDTKLEALRAELGLPKGQRIAPGGGAGPGAGDTGTAPEASPPSGYWDREREHIIALSTQVHAELVAERATFSGGTVATPQDLPFPPKVTLEDIEAAPESFTLDADGTPRRKLVLPTRMRKESKATCMKCGQPVDPEPCDACAYDAGGSGWTMPPEWNGVVPDHTCHTCPPGTPDFPPEPMPPAPPRASWPNAHICKQCGRDLSDGTTCGAPECE